VSDRRVRLAQSLLALPDPGTPLSEEQKGLSAAGAQLVLGDLYTHIAAAFRKRGPGLPIIRPDGVSHWTSTDELRHLVATAESCEDSTMAALFRSVLLLLEDLDPDKSILMALSSPDAIKIYRLDPERIGAQVQAFLKDW
jgi:hypothetical protein